MIVSLGFTVNVKLAEPFHQSTYILFTLQI